MCVCECVRACVCVCVWISADSILFSVSHVPLRLPCLQEERKGRLQHATHRDSNVSRLKLIYIIRSISKKVPGIRCYNLQELPLWKKKCTLTSFVALGMQSEGNAPKNGKTNSCFLLRDNAPGHRSILVKDFLAQNNMTTLEHPPPHPTPPPFTPDLSPPNFYLFPPMNSALRNAFVMLLTSVRMWRSYTGFHKTNVSKTFTFVGSSI